MFNPKHNLLEEQLAVSGLEMNAGPLAVFAGISAATSIIGGIMGSSQASQNNRLARENAAAKRAAAEEQANKTNA